MLMVIEWCRTRSRIAWKGSRASRHRRRTDLPDGPPRFAIKWREPEPVPGAAVR